MRKMLNKKGFSLVELMIVVVIMGILIAVAIPLYGAITDNANNKTCANNIKSIKTNAANYKATYNKAASTTGIELADMFDDGEFPLCPLAEGEEGTNGANKYVISIDQATGAAKVKCPFAVADNAASTVANSFHKQGKIGSDTIS